MSRAKQPQILEIDPSHELRFQGPYNEVVTATLKLFNPSDKKVCFKVKTTAPRRYCVRPNSGVVDSKSQVNVSVMLQPIDGDANDKGKHKFMVQSMFAPDNVEDMDKLWSEASPGDLMDSKLRCVFEETTSTPEEKPELKMEASTMEVVAEKEAKNPEMELRLIMEECKRLQAENSKFKQLYDEVKCQVSKSPAAGVEEFMIHVKANMLLVMIAVCMVFGVGIMIGVSI